MPKFYDRVKDTTTTTGTGTITVSGTPPTGYAALSTAPTGSKISYVIAGQGTAEWEVGEGTVASGTTMSRDTVRASSNAGALVNFSGGTKDFWIDCPAIQVHRSGIGRQISLKTATN